MANEICLYWLVNNPTITIVLLFHSSRISSCLVIKYQFQFQFSFILFSDLFHAQITQFPIAMFEFKFPGINLTAKVLFIFNFYLK